MQGERPQAKAAADSSSSSAPAAPGKTNQMYLEQKPDKCRNSKIYGGVTGKKCVQGDQIKPGPHILSAAAPVQDAQSASRRGSDTSVQLLAASASLPSPDATAAYNAKLM